MERALDAGADDVQREDERFVVSTGPTDFHAVQTALKEKDVEVVEAELAMVPKNTVQVAGKEAQSLWTALSNRSLVGRTVTVKLRTGDFRTATRRLTPGAPPASGDELASIGAELLHRFEFPTGSRYRLAGIGVSNFIEESSEEREPALFGTMNDER